MALAHLLGDWFVPHLHGYRPLWPKPTFREDKAPFPRRDAARRAYLRSFNSFIVMREWPSTCAWT
jgi:hypothetical protein